jgi:antitoxin HicB
MIADAMRVWIEAALETGQDIPEPRPAEKYSGKFIVRLPRSLHRELVETAEREGVSLNMFVSTVLGKAVGQANPLNKKEYPQPYAQPREKRLLNEKTDPFS